MIPTPFARSAIEAAAAFEEAMLDAEKYGVSIDVERARREFEGSWDPAFTLADAVRRQIAKAVSQ